jgi:alpha-tubulin suppressor-like RCC1 family protein
MRKVIVFAGLLPGIAALAVFLPGSARPAAHGTGTKLAKAVAAGVGHSCVLTRAGGVECWGYNGHDELGTGTGSPSSSSRPVPVAGLGAGVKAISAGLRHSCALTVAGGVKCWGANYGGALGDGTTARRYGPVDVVGLASGTRAVAAGSDASCALTTTGGVKCWGSNQFGQVGDGTTVDRPTPVNVAGLGSGVKAIAAGGLFGCALTDAGAVECWGGSYGLTPTAIPGLTGVTAITVGPPICALTGDRRVKCWAGDYGATPAGIPGLGSGVAAVAASDLHACAVTHSGAVKCWGLNDHGQLGDRTTTDRLKPVVVVGLTGGASAIAAGAFHSCAVSRRGAVVCWGANDAGQLGDGTHHRRSTPSGVAGYAAVKLAIVSRVVRATSQGTAPVRLRCGAWLSCRGRVTITARGSKERLGSRSFSLAAGRTTAVRVKLTRRGFAQLVRAGRLGALVKALYAQPGSGSTKATRSVTLSAPSRR